MTFCSWPLPPQPEKQLELPPVCVGFAVWVVPLMFAAVASAVFPAVCVAELEPPTTSCPAMLTGTLAFTAVCFAFASASASCFVNADWSTVCDWPFPPQPDRQLELPPVCVGLADWPVVLVFDASALAELSAVWVAELEPPET